MEKFENVILISFGTTFMPSNETQMMIVEVIKSTPGIGYIWSLKPSKTVYKQVEAMKIPNLLLMKFVP